MSGKVAVAGAVTAGFPSPAEQYMEPPLDLNDLLVKRPAATYFVKAVVHGWFDAVRGEKNLRGVPSPMVGAHEGPVEAVTRSDEAVPRDLGLADAACVDVD